MRLATVRALVLAASVAAAAPARAHLVETGFGAFCDGLAHVALTPSDLLLVFALALLAGQRGTSAARWAVFVLPLAWLAGGMIGSAWPSVGGLPVWTTLTFLLVGVLVALNAKVGDAGVAAFALGVAADRRLAQPGHEHLGGKLRFLVDHEAAPG